MASTSLWDVTTIVSNVIFLLPAVQAACLPPELREWDNVCVYVCIVIFSSMYHACNSFSNTCIWAASTHRWLDFFFAQLVIPLTALHIIIFPPNWRPLKRILTIAFAVLIALIQYSFGEGNMIQILICGLAFGMILVYWAIFAMVASYNDAEHHKPRLPPYRWDMFGLGIGLTILACSLYTTEMQYHLFYWAIHVVWHIDAALGQFFILLIVYTPDNARKK